MAFKIKRFIPESPLHVEGVGSNINPGKELDSAQKHSKVRTYIQETDNFLNDKNNDGNMFTRAFTKLKKQRAENIQAYKNKKSGVSPTVNETKSVKTKKLTEGAIQGNVGGGKVKSQATKDGEAGYEADDKARKNKTGIYAPKKKKIVKKETKPSGKQSKLSKTNLGKKGEQKKFGEDVTMKSDKFVPASKESKAAPKDNSKKAIRTRKKADKAAGVSKSQMRANKAKSKSKAALEKAKKSKNPSYRAQLKAKSDRLAKRAKRKGNS